MNEHTLHAANAAIRANDHCENVQDLLRTIAQRLTLNDSHTPNRIEEAPVRSWRATLRLSVRDIVYPDEIIWIEDDDLLTEIEFAARVLDKIKDRFTR